MKKFLSVFQFILGFLGGMVVIYFSLFSDYPMSAAAGIFTFSMGCVLSAFSIYAAVKIATEKS